MLPGYVDAAGYTDPITDWFNKYTVTKVTETDPTGGAPAKVTSLQLPRRRGLAV